MAFRGRRRGRGRDRRPRRWGADQNAEGGTALAAAGTAYMQILASADYEQSATLEQGGVTLVRCRGSGTWMAGGVTGNDIAMAVYAIDEIAVPATGGVADPFVFSELIRGDLLWHRRAFVPVSTEYHFEFDIKSKRKMVDKQLIYVVRNAAGAGTGTIYVSARALVLGG